MERSLIRGRSRIPRRSMRATAIAGNTAAPGLNERRRARASGHLDGDKRLGRQQAGRQARWRSPAPRFSWLRIATPVPAGWDRTWLRATRMARVGAATGTARAGAAVRVGAATRSGKDAG